MQSFGLDAIAERRKSPLKKKWDAFTNYLEENRQHIFYIFHYSKDFLEREWVKITSVLIMNSFISKAKYSIVQLGTLHLYGYKYFPLSYTFWNKKNPESLDKKDLLILRSLATLRFWNMRRSFSPKMLT